MESTRRALSVGGRHFDVLYFDRPGKRGTLLFVHGLGNSSANFSGLCSQPALADYRLVAMDLPGCGDTPYPEPGMNIDDLVDFVEAFVVSLGLRRFLLVGASMGGLVALLYARRRPELLTGFVNVEGNLAPEDCMFSRKAIGHTFESFASDVFPQILASLRLQKAPGFTMHLEVLRRADVRAYFDHSLQTVSYSDSGRLLEWFIGLPIPRFFLYGDANRSLSYLPALKASPCTVVEIPRADHFVFYDNPAGFAQAVAGAVPGSPHAF